MKKLKSHFWYNKRQRNGIFFLLGLIILLQGIYFFGLPLVNKPGELTELPLEEIASFQLQIDSLKSIEIEKRKPKIYPYNPSFITDYKGYQLGMSTKEINKLLKHRADGKYINSAKHFQKVTGVSDSLLAVMSPNFKFPDWVVVKNKSTKKKDVYIGKKNNITIEKQDLNLVTAIQLKEIYGIGEKLSERIVKFRASLNGFISDDQLSEVYGLTPEVIDRVLERYTVLSKPTFKKLNVNTATFKEVLRLPYIDYELTKKIFDYRDEVAELQSIEELKLIEGFPLELYDKIIVYLEAK
ncbi:MAG: helix-hairpin-helix domain-containing protein [Urechidicola sp.]|nr:helix-hairpin-helix domain-containing protein [Urechidicola sp.]